MKTRTKIWKRKYYFKEYIQKCYIGPYFTLYLELKDKRLIKNVEN